jgi:hypothetical protein
MRLDTRLYDWKNIKQIPEGDRQKQIINAFNHAIKKIGTTPLIGSKMVGADANLMSPSPIVLINLDTVKMPDRGYEAIFKEVDMRQSANGTFEVMDIKGGVTFYQQKPGEEVKLTTLPASSKTNVSFLRFAGGFSILDDWLRFNEFYRIDQLSEDTLRRWYDQKASIFYGMITALTGIDQAYDTDDATTINNACAQILNDLTTAGYAVDENSQFVIACNPSLRGKIYKALAASFINPNVNNNQVMFNIPTIVSTSKIANTSYYVALPGGKCMRGEWEDLNARPAQRNELKLGADHVWTGSFNGIIGEKLQFRKCAIDA